jgi:hypothetical protein
LMIKDTNMKNLIVAAALAITSVTTPAAQGPGPATFATPEQAVEAVIKAAASGAPALLALLGPDGKDLVTTGDAVQDQKDRDDFVRLAKEKAAIVKDPASPNRAVLLIGNDAFPGAIPLVLVNGRWLWSADEGRYEILVRRIGANELDTIAVCRGYVDAQQEYAAADPDKSGVKQASETGSTGRARPAARKARSAKRSPAPSRRAIPPRVSRITATSTRSSRRRAPPPRSGRWTSWCGAR